MATQVGNETRWDKLDNYEGLEEVCAPWSRASKADRGASVAYPAF